MKCTIKDIAAQLGMSRNTIAKALKGAPGVSDETREMIHEKAREMNYRTFLSQTSRTSPAPAKGNILFLTRASVNYSEYWITVMKGIDSVLADTPYRLILGIMDDEDMRSCNFPAALGDTTTMGVIMVEICDPKICNELLKYNLPMVTVDMSKDYQDQINDFDIVTMENKMHIKEITNRLISAGKKRFAFAGDIYSSNVSRGFQERYASLCETLESAGLKLDQDASLLRADDKELSNFSGLLKKIHSFSPMPEVFVCGNDWTAIQIMHALQHLDYSIPKDISIVGFDNIQAASKTVPPLTTINAPKEQLGIAAAKCIIDRIHNPYMPHLFTQYTSKLIIRGSVDL